MTGLLISLFFACSSEIDNKEAAKVKEASTVSKEKGTTPNSKVDSKAATSNDAGGWALAPTSKVEWVGAKVTKDHSGGFKSVTGMAQVEGKELKQITADIDITSLFSDHPKLTKHLLNQDFFEVAKFTKASFRSTEISKDNIKGILALHGVEKEISFPAKINFSDNQTLPFLVN